MADTDDLSLAELRGEIDRIDAGLHGLLMERGLVIDRLIAAKGTAASGSAFRPRREAAMMRALAERHAGRLPFDAVEAIWRILISTFTHLQAPFAVHGPAVPDPVALQDSARFHFGFTVPYRALPGPDEVVAAVAASRGDLGLLPVGEAATPWWTALEGPSAPKVIARLPFVARAGHPAGLPLLVVAKAGSGEAPAAIRVRSVAAGGPGLRLAACGSAALVAASADDVAGVEVGSYPAPFRLG